MTAARVEKWSEHWSTPMTEQSIRDVFVPAYQFRISPSKYPPATSFGGAMRSGKCFVISGACEFTCGDTSVALHAGEFAELPEGEYGFKVLGDRAVELVMVWRLPEELWQP